MKVLFVFVKKTQGFVFSFASDVCSFFEWTCKWSTPQHTHEKTTRIIHASGTIWDDMTPLAAGPDIEKFWAGKCAKQNGPKKADLCAHAFGPSEKGHQELAVFFCGPVFGCSRFGFFRTHC